MSSVIDLCGIEKITNPCYLPLYANTSRYLVLYGGAGSGKSYFIAQKILFRLLTERGHKFLIARKVARTLRYSCFALFCSCISKWGLEEFFSIHKSTMQITFLPNNNTLLFYGLDNVEKIKSIDGISGIWIEEASELKKEDFLQLDLRLRGKSANYKQIILSFNPISTHHWLREHFFRQSLKECTITKSTYLDNAFIDRGYKQVLENLKTSNLAYYKIYALGEWGVLEGLVYENYKIIEKFPSECVSVFYGIDFGFNDPTAVVRVGLRDNEAYIEELLYKTHLTTSEIITTLNYHYPELKDLNGYFEVSEPDRLKEFRGAGYNVHLAKKSILEGINKVKSYRLHICANSSNLLREINTYVWDRDKNGVLRDTPIDLDNHALDALRYALFTHTPPTNPQSYLYYKENIQWA